MPAPVKTPTKAPTKTPQRERAPQPDRDLYPSEICPQQKREFVSPDTPW